MELNKSKVKRKNINKKKMEMKSKISDFISRAYGTACSKGFHEKDLSIRHFMMLVLTEVCEAVEADRKSLHADLRKFDDVMKCTGGGYNAFCDVFVNYVKDSVEDDNSMYYYCGVVLFDNNDASFKLNMFKQVFDGRNIGLSEGVDNIMCNFVTNVVYEGQTPQVDEYCYEVIGNIYDNIGLIKTNE